MGERTDTYLVLGERIRKLETAILANVTLIWSRLDQSSDPCVAGFIVYAGEGRM